MDFEALEAVVRLAEPCVCESPLSTFTPACVWELLDLKARRLPLQELWVVFDGSGALDQTALALEHVRWAVAWGEGRRGAGAGLSVGTRCSEGALRPSPGHCRILKPSKTAECFLN